LHKKFSEYSAYQTEKAVDSLKDKLKDDKFLEFLSASNVSEGQIEDMWKFFR
jgi:hypothetical protein